MITEIRIQGQPIEIPDDLEIKLEEISPLKNTTITTGDFSQSFKFPASPKNRQIFEFVDQIQLADKTIRFDQVIIQDEHFGTIRGSLLIQETITDFGSGTIDADFFTNLLDFDIFNDSLADAVAPFKIDLGADTDAIITEVKAQNTNDLQTEAGFIDVFIPWTPLDLGADLVLWYDFDDDAMVSENNGIESILDKSPAGNDSQSTALANRAARAVNATSGRKVYSNDASHKFIQHVITTPSPNYTHFMVYLQNNPGVRGALHFSRSPSVTGFDDANALGSVLYYQLGGNPTIDFVNGAAGNVTVPGNMSIVMKESAETSASRTFRVGSDPNYTNRNIDGEIADIIIVSRPLTTDERQMMEGYLAHKNGIQSSLPIDHPYLSAPPGETETQIGVPDGTSVMKFIPHRNPDFFPADQNPSWNPDASEYDSTQSYSAGDIVEFQASRAFDAPEKYVCILAANEAETPSTHPAKWQKIPNAILNDWDLFGGGPYANETQEIGGTYYQNFHAIVPWMQLHYILRKAVEGIGYDSRGQFLQDLAESRLLLCSNFALSKHRKYILRLQLNDFSDQNVLSIPQDPGPIATTMESIVISPAAENDAESLFDEPGQTITISRKGIYRVRASGTVWIDELGTFDTRLFVQLNDTGGTPIASGFQDFPLGSFPDGVTTQAFEIEFFYEYDYSGADGSQSVDLTLAADILYDDTLGGVLTNTIMEVSNITYQGIDEFNGELYVRDHVPDITMADFLEALRTWKNLFISFDGKSKIIRFDYADDILNAKNGVLDLDPYKIGTERIQHRPRKKFQFQFGILPENTSSSFSGYTFAGEIDKIQDIGGFILGNNIHPSDRKALYVKSLNAWLLTGSSRFSDRTVWVLYSQNWPTFNVENDGDLEIISPELGPIPMSFFQGFAGELLQAPITSGEGRSSAVPLKGERLPFLVCYWNGMDSETTSAVYPYASPVRRNTAGSVSIIRGMEWDENFPLFWSRSIQSLIQEEIITRSFLMHPDASRGISFAQRVLLSNVPMMIMKRLRALGGIASQQLEMRRIQNRSLETFETSNDSTGSFNAGGSGGVVAINTGASEGKGGGKSTLDSDWFARIEQPTDGTYLFRPSSAFSGVIKAVGAQTDAGTAEVKFQIGGTDLGGGHTSASDTYSEVSHTIDHAFGTNDQITLVLTNVSGVAVIDIIVKYTQSL